MSEKKVSRFKSDAFILRFKCGIIGNDDDG